MSKGLRVLIADDHPIVRRGLREILTADAQVTEVIEAEHPQQVLDLARTSGCDVVVLDLGLPGRGGLEVLKDLRRDQPKLPVLILSMQPEEQYAVRALRAGAAGYLTKEAAPDKLVEAIHKVTSGGRYISEAWVEREGLHGFGGYPLLVDDRLVGVMTMFSRTSLSHSTIATLAIVAKQLALGIEHKKRTSS